MKRLYIIGAGGHGKVVAEAGLAAGYEIGGFFDNQKKSGEIILMNYKVVGSVAEAPTRIKVTDRFVVAIGNNEHRRKIYESISETAQAATIIHPSAIVSANAKVGNGSVVLANSVINAGSEIGDNTIINSMVLIDHDTVVGSHSHIAQGTIIGSNCKLPDTVTTEIGQAIKSFTAK